MRVRRANSCLTLNPIFTPIFSGAQLRETPGRVVVPALERLAAIVDGNDEMRGFFVEAGGVPRLSQLAASDLEPCKGAVNCVASCYINAHRCWCHYVFAVRARSWNDSCTVQVPDVSCRMLSVHPMQLSRLAAHGHAFSPRDCHAPSCLPTSACWLS